MQATGKALAKHWIEQAEREAPIVAQLDSKAYMQLRSRLSTAIERKARLVPKLIAETWRQRIFKPILFDWQAASLRDASMLLGWLRDRHPNLLDWPNSAIVSSTREKITVSDKFRQVTITRLKDGGGLQLTCAVPTNTEEKTSFSLELDERIPCEFSQEGQSLYVRGATPEYSGILHEVSKTRLKWTLRRFVQEFGSRGAFELFPVWLCSPETVSAIMPLRQGFFDCVIFDEASQCPLEKAVPSIYRAKTVVVSGDDKQLPPFDLFSSFYDEVVAADDEYNAGDEVVNSESLLHAASRYEYNPLCWHYRSRYEPLIRFSNAAFYQNTLQTMPNAERNTVCFRWVKLAGEWAKRRNQAEAEKVVEIVGTLLDDPARPSIGVITFNSEQRDLILSKLEARARADHDFAVKYEREKVRKEEEELKNIFVKNIENVQGDERDAIIFSIAYAKGAKGGLKNQFGSLSMPGGENRLNVAISRAKDKTFIITSIEPEDLRTDTVFNFGPKRLKQYLQYARAVAQGDNRTADDVIKTLVKTPVAQAGQTGSDAGFEEEVGGELVKMGYRVNKRVGASSFTVDLAVIDPKNPGRYALGIELDGENYKNVPSAVERDAYRPRFLRSRGWNTYRLSSRDWSIDKAGVLKEIKAKIEVNGKG